MEFQELSRVWQNADQDFQEKIQLDLLNFESIDQKSVRPQMKSYLINVLIELMVGVAFQSFLNSFIGAYWNATAFLVPAVLLTLINVYSIVFNAYQLYLYFQINLDQPVLGAQRIINRLRKLERIDTYSLLLIIPVCAGPFLIVIAKHFLGINLYEFSQYFVPFFVMNFVVAAIIVILLRVFPDKELKESQEFLDSITNMEKGYIDDLV